MWSVARRPRWIAALVFALALAAGFAALSQWQLARSVQNGTVAPTSTESVEELSSITRPQSPVTDKLDGQLVETRGRWVAGDYVIVSDRLNDGTAGYWVVGHFSAATKSGDGAGLAVALGWAPTAAKARSVENGLDPLTNDVMVAGRYNVGEAPQDSDFQKGKLSTVSPGAMMNVWKTTDPAGVYGGYLVSGKAVAGLDTIYSPKPTSTVQVDLLNIFYAIEWIVFAGFAVFLWYRLVRDAWEREEEEKLENELLQRAEVN